MISKLIFVYNANSGALNSLMDSVHKIISPKTYDCKLCDLTYDVFKENELWSRFRESVKNDDHNAIFQDMEETNRIKTILKGIENGK